MATLEKAIELAVRFHAGQKDKQDQPYILHPLRAMQRVQGEGEETQIVAVLHDTLEDTELTTDDLREAGFSETVIANILLVTHQASQSYADYVVGCSRSPIARQVKLADLEDNSRIDRVLLRPDRAERDLARIHRYLFSYRFLRGQISEEQYRSLMATHG